jgi:hypothetical protein
LDARGEAVAAPPFPNGARLRSARPLLGFWLLLGAVSAVVVVGVGAPLQSAEERRLIAPWLSVATAPWQWAGWTWQPRTTLILAVVCLVLAWVGVALQILRQAPRPAVLWAAVGTWAAPFVLAPPFLSRDAYAYLAQGQVLRQGLDPYRHAVSELGASSSVLLAVDPRWRHTVPPYGPVALRIEQLCSWLGFGREWQSLVALRVVVVLCLLGALLLIRAGSPAALRARNTWLVCSPLLLLQLVAACHLEAVMCVLLVAGVAVVHKDRFVFAAVLITTAAEIKATALAAVVLLILFAHRTGGRERVQRVLAGTLATALAGALLMPHDPFGWVAGLASAGRSWAPATPSSTVFLVMADVGRRLDLPVGPAVLRACQIAGLVAGGLVLLWIARRAPRQTLAWCVAMTTLALLLAAPLLWPWYLAPVALLMLQAGRPLAALLLGAVPALFALPVQTVHAQRVAVIAEIVAAVFLLWLYGRVPQSARMTGSSAGRVGALLRRVRPLRGSTRAVAWRALLGAHDVDPRGTRDLAVSAVG